MCTRGAYLLVTSILFISGCASVLTQENDQELTKETESSRRFEKFLDDYMLNEIADISKIISFYKSQSEGMTEEEKDEHFVFIYKYFEGLVEAYNTVALDNSFIQRKFWNEEETWDKYGVITLDDTACYSGLVSCAYLKSQFKGYVSNNILDFLDIRAQEQQIEFQSDGAIMIPWKDLAQRCIIWENYLKTHTSSKLEREAQKFSQAYVSSFLVGTANTRVCWDYEDWKDSPQMKEIRAAFEWLISEYPQNEISKLVKEYLPILDKAGWSDDPAVKAFLRVHDIRFGYASYWLLR